MLDFRHLRASVEGQRGSFEELVCQLAALSPPSGATTFRRIEGSGGDGGIECYWDMADGSKEGYQAKFHAAARDIDWSAIDQSFQTAAANYPELRAFTIAVACDLGGPVKNRKGVPATKRWDDLRAKWSAQMAAAGRTVRFAFWGKLELGLRLARPEADGLLAFWFDEAFLSEDWLRKKFNEAELRLDERFHPEDHVEVSAADAIKGVRRSREWVDKIGSLFRDVVKEAASVSLSGSGKARAHAALQVSIAAFQSLEADLGTAVQLPFPTATWVGAARKVADGAYRLEKVLQRAAVAKAQGRKITHRSDLPFYREREQLSKLKLSADFLLEELASLPSAAADARQLMLTGRAGGGKSHLLAMEVQHALEDEAPAIFLLGTDFGRTNDPEGQILSVIDERRLSFDAFLNALNAAALCAGKRGLIAIDALNEGAGSRLWRSNLAAFIDKVMNRHALAIVLTVRTEFIDMVVPSSTKDTIPALEVDGFTELEEQEAAAQVYMDRRGIVRPATPWLSPEFTNPLFLRTTCLALQQASRTEFPRGLLGTKQLLAFYLDTAATNLGSDYDGSTDLAHPLRQAVAGVARTMASNRQDFITRSDAALVIDAAFRIYASPPGTTWTDLLQRSGLLRADAQSHDPDPFASSEPVYRFGFQRFQDHLVAEALLRGKQPQHLFTVGGPLAFMLAKGSLNYEWLGVFQAVAIQLADDHGVEVVDVLPGGQAGWWDQGDMQDAFTQSVRWRSPQSFTKRSEDLLNQLYYGAAEAISLLLEVSIVKEHAWNADHLHARLKALPMSERDALWTEAINTDAREDTYPANRLVDWMMRGGIAAADEEALRLSLTVLGWLFTSTDGRLRDRASKAAVAILILAPSQFAAWLRAFASVDDVYVLERLLAAAAGASLRDPSRDRLKQFTRALDLELIQPAAVPVHLLARDYLQLIFELAAAKGTAPIQQGAGNSPTHIKSSPPVLNLVAANIEAQAKGVGDRSIYASCCGLTADFGRYVIDSRTRGISSVPLTSAQPMTFEEAAKDFRGSAITGWEDREETFDLLSETRPKAGDSEAMAQARQQLSQHLRSLLDPACLAEFDSVILPFLKGASGLVGHKGCQLPRHDQSQLRLWVAKRALDLGWTEQLFPRDSSGGSDRTRAERTERIGKKYQWIAYFELLARLADNYWLAPDWNEGRARRYSNPCDLPFTRDIDTTTPVGPNVVGIEDKALLPKLTIASTDALDRKMWTFEDLAPGHMKATQSLAAADTHWVALFRSDDATTRWPIPDRMDSAPYRQQEFAYAFLLLCDPKDRDGIIEVTRRTRFDFHDWLESDYTDGPYLYELGVRDTWPRESWQTVYPSPSRELAIRRPWHSYVWEHHLDGTLAEGLGLVVPAPWLLRELKLSADPRTPGQYRDQRGETIIRSFRDGRQSWCLIREEELQTALTATRLSPLWVGFGERSAWPRPAKNDCYRRRWNGVLAPTAGNPLVRSWNSDDNRTAQLE